MNKSLEKSRLFQKGGPQGPGRGPEKGASHAGRPPDDFYEWLSGVFNSPRVRARFESIMETGDPSTFMKGMLWASERMYGKPVQPLQASGTLQVVWRQE